jgi:hypothetical protein
MAAESQFAYCPAGWSQATGGPVPSPTIIGSGTTATLTKVSSTITLTGGSGFTSGITGSYVYISGAATSGNNGWFQVTYVSATSISWTNASGATDANNGAISWLTSAAQTTNSFVTPWNDKRSGASVGLSVVFYGGTPTGTLTVETSNAPEVSGAARGAPQNSGDDALTLTGSSQTVTASAGPFQWQISGLPARWVRIRYTSTQVTAGLTANVYLSSPRESP